MSDSREIAAHEGGRDVSAARATSITPQQRLEMMREAMTNPAVDPDKARAMFKLMGEMEDRERQAEYNRDKGAAIRAMPAIFKRGHNTHTDTRYAKFEDMHRAVMPTLARYNLTLDFRLGYEGNFITVTPILRHDNGYIEEGGTMKGPADEGKGRSAIQAIGSASSYLKRYSLRAMLNIIEDGEDDDGMGVARPNYQLNDRQEGLLVDAQAAHDRGEYQQWFGNRDRKDKAILINSGTHERLGGAKALPGAQTVDNSTPTREERRADPPARSDPPKAEQTREPEQPVIDASTPEGWAETFIAACEAAPDTETLERVKAKGTNGMGRLAENNMKLWEKCDLALMEAQDRLAKAPAKEGLFGDD